MNISAKGENYIPENHNFLDENLITDDFKRIVNLSFVSPEVAN
jgi:hypothetical protein